MARVQALWNIGEEGLAIEEWNYLLQRQPKMSAAYAEIALERGWPGLAVQASIQGDAVRVTGAKRDDLQATMALLKKEVTEAPLGFNNFRD